MTCPGMQAVFTNAQQMRRNILDNLKGKVVEILDDELAADTGTGTGEPMDMEPCEEVAVACH